MSDKAWTPESASADLPDESGSDRAVGPAPSQLAEANAWAAGVLAVAILLAKVPYALWSGRPVGLAVVAGAGAGLAGLLSWGIYHRISRRGNALLLVMFPSCMLGGMGPLTDWSSLPGRLVFATLFGIVMGFLLGVVAPKFLPPRR